MSVFLREWGAFFNSGIMLNEQDFTTHSTMGPIVGWEDMERGPDKAAQADDGRGSTEILGSVKQTLKRHNLYTCSRFFGVPPHPWQTAKREYPPLGTNGQCF